MATSVVGPASPPARAPERLTDPGRLAALRASGLLDGAASPVLDRLARLAARLLGTPDALVSLVDDRRQHLPGAAGAWDADAARRVLPLSYCLCRHVVAAGAPLAVDDAARHPTTCDSPAVTRLGVAAYLGVPITTADGDTLGALAVTDARPRAWSDDDVATLADLAAAALSEIMLRVQASRYRLAVEASQEVIYAHDCLTGHVTREGAVEAIYGRCAAALPPTTESWLALVLPEDRARVVDGWNAALAGEVSHWVCEYRLVHPDGRVVVVRDAARVLRDASGAPQRVAGAVTDVTVQRAAEEALRASEEQARGLLEAAYEGICTVDVAGTITYANARMGEMLGAPPHELAGTSFFALLEPAAAAEARARFGGGVGGGGGGVGERVELPIRRRDGSTLWVSQSASTLRDGEGTFAGALFLLTDVTAWRRAEERFARAVEATDDGLWDWDVTTGEVCYSPRWCRMLGHEPGTVEPTVRTWKEAVHPDDWPAVRDALGRHLRGETPQYASEHRLRHRDGSWIWLLDRGKVVARDPVGRPQRVVGTHTDVTERRAADRAVAEAEQRFRSLSASSPVGIFEADLAGSVTYANARLEEIWDASEAELRGHGWMARVHRDDRKALVASWSAALAAGEEYECRYRLRFGDGRVRWVHARSARLRDGAGAPVGVVGTIEDVTERQATEAALADALAAARESEAWSRASFDAMPGSMAVVDPETARFVSFNDDACATLGYTRAEFAELTVPDVEDPAERDAVLALLGTASSGTARRQCRRRHRTKSGEAREVLVTTRPFEAAGRRLTFCTWIDVTDQVRADEERRALEERLRQAQKMEAVGQLAGGVAHDFNNLLTVIAGNLEFVQADLPADHPVRPDLDEIGRASERARALVRQLLTFSRKQPVRPQRVALGELVRGAEKMLRRVIGEEIALAVHVADGVPPVHADAGQLEQVLLNLAVNARDAMLTPLHGHAGTGGTLQLEVGSVALTAAEARAWDGVTAGEWVRLVVRDSGHGMDAATRAHAFEPFFTTKAVGAGTGLGLASAFGIVRQAGGAIRVESAPGQGAAFTILLPPDGAEREDGEAARARAAAAAPALTVLLVEDEAPVRVAMRRMLERRGCAVLEARHGADALLVWRAHRAGVDAVVTDLRMPEMGGRELIALVRAESPALPVVFVSGYSDQGPPADAGPHDAFVEKPLSADALLAALERVVERRAAR